MGEEAKRKGGPMRRILSVVSLFLFFAAAEAASLETSEYPKNQSQATCRVEDSININATPERVSQYMWNVSNLSSYIPVSDVKILESGRNIMRLRHKLIVAGITIELVSELKKGEKDHSIAYKSIEGAEIEGAWVFEPTEKGTRLVNVLKYNRPESIFGRILNWLKLEKEMKKICNESLQRLKHILEPMA